MRYTVQLLDAQGRVFHQGWSETDLPIMQVVLQMKSWYPQCVRVIIDVDCP